MIQWIFNSKKEKIIPYVSHERIEVELDGERIEDIKGMILKSRTVHIQGADVILEKGTKDSQKLKGIVQGIKLKIENK